MSLNIAADKLLNQNSIDDWLEFNKYHYYNSKSLKNQRVLIRFIGPIFFSIFVICHSYYKSFDLVLAVVFAVISILWIVFYPKKGEADILKRVKKMIEEGKNKELNTDIKIKVSEENIFVKSENITSTVNWELVEKIVMNYE